jgi:hypothetical protein
MAGDEMKKLDEVQGTFDLRPGRPGPLANLKRWLDQIFGDYHPLDDDHTFNDDQPSPSPKRDGL